MRLCPRPSISSSMVREARLLTATSDPTAAAAPSGPAVEVHEVGKYDISVPALTRVPLSLPESTSRAIVRGEVPTICAAYLVVSRASASPSSVYAVPRARRNAFSAPKALASIEVASPVLLSTMVAAGVVVAAPASLPSRHLVGCISKTDNCRHRPDGVKLMEMVLPTRLRPFLCRRPPRAWPWRTGPRLARRSGS